MANDLTREAYLGSQGPSEDVNPSENLSKERIFGQDMRRLLKLVLRAFLNPSELKNVNAPPPV
jgi:hypothetical protein